MFNYKCNTVEKPLLCCRLVRETLYRQTAEL